MKFANRFDTKRLLVRRAFNGMARAYPRGVIAKLRALAVLATIVVACTTVTSPLPSPTELFTQSPFVSPTATPTPAALHARSVTRVGDAIVASGHFDGSRSTQVAVIRDPSNDLGVQIAVRRGSVEDSSTETEWFKSEPAFLSLPRAKFAVADLDGDGKDDLAALYDAGGFTSRLYVFKSTGSAFTFANAWWSGDDYPWARARAILGARTGTRDALFVMYQDDGARLRIHQFNSDGTKLAPPVTVFDSGKGQFDIAKARFAVGRFTRALGGEQIAALYQSGSKATVIVFESTPSGFTMLPDVYTTDVDISLAQTSLGAIDVNGDGRDDLVLQTLDADGGAKIHVLDAAASFHPVGGWGGVATLPAGSSCAYAGALGVGDWDGDGRGDALSLAPAAASSLHATALRANGTTFVTASSGATELRCPTWPLNGLPLAGGDPTKRPIYVKVDNNPTARPHYGISKADQVYEWLVEGLTTRLAAVFQSQQPDVIGAVRSARMTDRPVIPSLGAIFVYSGGGPEELMALNYDAAVAKRYIDLGPSYGWGYRVDSRPAPYNYFTSYRNVMAAVANADDADQPVIVASWKFLPTADGDPASGGFGDSAPATTIDVPYRGGFPVRYTYDANTRTYARFDDGVREVDAANNVAIAARNIVVIQTEVHFTTEFGLDPAGNPKLDEKLTGTGKGIVFRDGQREDVTWTRNDIVDAFTVRNASGELVLLSPGQTWIHVVPQDWTIPSR
ncbi:MAG: DUF3048 domain-containing protein [Chloroflexi bacterium]|nr:MAG: DUF3048 domain-containing protein [Chloroflexota bacterium]